MDNMLKCLVRERINIVADCAAKDELITRLADEAEVINADRAAQDVMFALNGGKAAIDRARRSWGDQVAQLAREQELAGSRRQTYAISRLRVNRLK